jgi:hypothetical protein
MLDFPEKIQYVSKNVHVFQKYIHKDLKQFMGLMKFKVHACSWFKKCFTTQIVFSGRAGPRLHAGPGRAWAEIKGRRIRPATDACSL